ncbi:MAG: hypothetical protein DHS20C12_16390 [Pseudohongiella sp.]|nr:MAG: hypothetical protein DHS20C12_16390 [Pseudohongiella sp.]
MSTLSSFLQTRRRLLSWLGGLLLGYALLGFLLLPWLVESQLEKLLDERLSATLEVESLYFNPFSFYFELEQLSLSDSEQGALLNLDSLRFNFQASRLALLKLQLSELSLAGLNIYYTRNSVTDDTVSRLARRWESSDGAAPEPETDSTESGELIPLEILSLSLSNISTHIIDRVPATEFSTTLSLAQAQVDNFSTLPDRSGNNALTLHFEEDAQLSWSGGFTVNPLDFQGEIALENFSLLPVYRYLQDTLPFELDDGHINLTFDYDIDLSQQEPSISVENIALSLNQLAATQHGQGSPFIELESLALNSGNISIPGNRAEFDTLSLRAISVNASRDESGLINFQQMIDQLTPESEPATEEPEVPTDAATPWYFSLASLSVEDNRISFSDNSLESPFTTAMTLDASLSEIDNQVESRFPLTSKLSLDSGGEVELSGQLQALPALELENSLSLSGIEISALQSYVSEFAFLELVSGSLNLDADIRVNASEPFSINGGVALQDVEISDQQLNETIFSMNSLGVDAMTFSLAENNLDISEVALEDFFARVLINEDGSSNIGRSIKTSDEVIAVQTLEETVPAEVEPLAITVGRLSLANASANFTDRNLPLPFDANIQNLEGSVQGFANNSSQATEISLEGQVDEFGLVQIVSSLNPFNFSQQSQIDVNFSNVDMPSMTPYVIKFAGREIAEGKVDVGLSYAILKGELTANNQVVLSALQLGERIESPDAMDLPLDLALALLKDGNGVIDLEVPITGNVNDPEFNFGPAIRRAISNILTNIVAAPFRLLGSLVGGGSDEASLEQIRFLPGRADVAAPEQEILLQLSEALKQRPQLLLEIPAVTATADELVLRTQAVDNRIETILETQPASEDSLTQRRLAAFESLYSEGTLPESLDAIRLANTPAPAAASDDPAADVQPATLGQLDTLAYIADLRERLIAAENISSAEIDALGSARRDSVVEFLLGSGGIPADRLLQSESVVSELDDDGWLELPFGLTAR